MNVNANWWWLLVILPFPVFTRLCRPYVKVRYTDNESFVPDGVNDAGFLVDIGVGVASNGGIVASMHFIRFVMRYSRGYPTLFVVPDSWDIRQYMGNIRRFIGLARRLDDRVVDNMIPILPVHYYFSYVGEYVELLNELSEVFPVVLVGVPGNMVTASPTGVFKCIRKQSVCNHYIDAVVRDVVGRGFKAHVLGITRPTLDYIVRRGLSGVVSADTDKPRGSGRDRLANRGEYCEAFREWLVGYEQPDPSDWLERLIQ